MAARRESARRFRLQAWLVFHELMLVLLSLSTTAIATAAELPSPQSIAHAIGTVTDSQGKPLADALVGIRSAEAQRLIRSSGLLLATKTDALGRFDLSVPRSLRTVTFVARRAGFL